MESRLTKEEIAQVKEVLKSKKIRISNKEIESHLSKLVYSQEEFPILLQKALLVRLLHTYEHTRKKEVILLEELDHKKAPVTVILGVLAEDWVGMSNSILGIVHHKKRNVLYVRGFTFEYEKKPIGVVILSFKIDKEEEYREFLKEKKNLYDKIKVASRGSVDKYLFLDDEAVKFEIYNDIMKKIYKIYHNPNLVKIIEESGEALKFVSSRSREYLEEREIGDLAKLIVDNYSYQNLIVSGYADEIVKVKNFTTKYEKLTGITFICREVLFSVEDFLRMLEFIVPGHVIKHHKSYVTMDGVMVYRVEIVDRYGRPLSSELIKSLEKSMDKLINISCSKEFTKLKSVGGIEHYARAIIPFLMDELRGTGLTQVFFNVERKTEFTINIKLIIVGHFKSKKRRLYDLIYRIGMEPGIEIVSTIPTKVYGKKIEVDILKLKVNLVEFSSVKEIFTSLKRLIQKVYGDIRDFDEGFRDIYIKILNQLLEKLETVNPALIRDIFFSIDDIYRIEIPQTLLMELIILCAEVLEKAREESCDKIIVKYKNVEPLRKTIFVVSYEEQRKILSKLVKKLEDITFYCTKIEWNQRYYLLMILSRKNEALDKDFINGLKKDIKKSIK